MGKGTGCKPASMSSIPGSTWWKERTDFLQVVSDCHIRTVAHRHTHTHTCMHPHMYTHASVTFINCNEGKKKEFRTSLDLGLIVINHHII